MKHLNSIKQRITVLATLILFAMMVHGAPINRKITLTQPDGTTIEAIIQGDEFFAFTKSIDGYTLEVDVDGWWTYAVVGEDGNLTAGSERYSANQLKSSSNEKGIMPSSAVMQQITNRRTLFNEQVQQKMKQAEKSLKATHGTNISGVWNVPVVRIQFTDLTGTKTTADFEEFFHDMDDSEEGDPYGGSFNQYYYENSQGTFTIKAHIFNWVTANNNQTYYANSHTDSQSRVRQMTREAINELEANNNIDWSIFDNQNSGNVDMVMVIHAGEGAAWRGNDDYIWAHMWWDLNISHDGVDFDVYNVQPELQDGEMASIGLYAHEFGHALGLPDLYDYNYVSQGIGDWGIMAGGSWLGSGYCPSHFCAWSKTKLGWASPIEIKDNNSLITVKKYHEYGDPINNNVYRFSSDNPDEYFLISNRRQDSYDWYLPGEGLIIEHINEQGDNSDRNDPLVQIVEADGEWNLYDNGYADGGDVFPGSSNVTMFSDATNPSANLRNGNTSGLFMRNISQVENSMDITFDNGFNPTDPPVIMRISGSGITGQPITITSECKGDNVTYSWKFFGAESSSSNEENPSVVYNNPGVYSAELTITNQYGSETKLIDACIMVDYSNGECAGAAKDGTGGDNINWVMIGDAQFNSEWSEYTSFKSQPVDLTIDEDFYLVFDIANFYDGDVPFAWIDWNRDGVFDTNEEINMPDYVQGDYITSETTVTPPSGAEGYYVLRIRNQWHAEGVTPTATPCGSDVYGEIEDFTINLIAINNINSGLCEGISADGLGGDYISNVIINGISYPSGKSLYSSFLYKDVKAAKNQLSVTVEIANNYGDEIFGWLDINQNDQFEANEVLSFNALTSTKAAATLDISSLALGKYSLRVRNQWYDENNDVESSTPTPCGNTVWGEVEDYLVEIVAAPVTTDIHDHESELFIDAYPNPVQDQLSIACSLDQADEVNFVICDLTGRVVLSESKNIGINGGVTTLNVAHLPKGIYIVKASTETESSIKRIVKQ
ncbi:M6 family metalloprotease domain-containing protein [Carboxylicivirga sp. M1479]|uniref:M6 family metalloprotease domain-containing protein n=1 Tax=Carboxylicivirga sp. M1479 TaxID=2594476 RepID=UPI00117869CD|nr:M6 family metalloprotease domain-containing protein [Carboxylicivirga sp. M1479]TRX72425.1 M6 family metalloprotease domain-containing protein [Carboxylicivirga sp. M1479]